MAQGQEKLTQEEEKLLEMLKKMVPKLYLEERLKSKNMKRDDFLRLLAIKYNKIRKTQNQGIEKTASDILENIILQSVKSSNALVVTNMLSRVAMYIEDENMLVKEYTNETVFNKNEESLLPAPREEEIDKAGNKITYTSHDYITIEAILKAVVELYPEATSEHIQRLVNYLVKEGMRNATKSDKKARSSSAKMLHKLIKNPKKMKRVVRPSLLKRFMKAVTSRFTSVKDGAQKRINENPAVKAYVSAVELYAPVVEKWAHASSNSLDRMKRRMRRS